MNTADPENVRKVKENVRKINPTAKIIESNMLIATEDDDRLTGKKVLIIEDGPTLTHGEMKYGAATLKAREMGAEIVDPRPYAVGSIKAVYDLWPHLGELLPAVGYSDGQIKDLEESINATPCDLVLMGTPTDLRRYITVDKPVLRVKYEYGEMEPGTLVGLLEDILP